MLKKKIRLILAFFVVILIICLMFLWKTIKKFSDNENENISDYKNKNEYIIKYNGNWEMLINHFLRGNINYNEMPLTINFRNKYKSINDIISGKCTGESMDSIFDEDNSNLSNIMTICYKTGNGLEEMVYKLHYIISDNNELDDIVILDSRLFEDENGAYKQYVKYHYYYDEPSIVTAALCYPYVSRNKNDEYYRVYVTNSFEKKFPDYLSTGITGDKDYIMYGDYYCDRNDRDICYAEFLGLDWTKTYKLTYDIDDKGYINDVDVKLYEKKKTEDPQYVKNLYQEYLDNIDN